VATEAVLEEVNRIAGRHWRPLSTDGPSIVAIAVAAHVINILAFGLDHWDHGMDEAAVTCLEWIARVEDLI
jgi:hypothetical protein